MSELSRNFNNQWKCRQQKRKFLDNPGNNILKLDNVSAEVQFATSKTKLDI